jgi:hypothetical protein
MTKRSDVRNSWWDYPKWSFRYTDFRRLAVKKIVTFRTRGTIKIEIGRVFPEATRSSDEKRLHSVHGECRQTL